MALSFIRSDLLAGISDKELTALTTKLTVEGQDSPVDVVMAEQSRRVEDYTARYVVPDDVLKRLWRALVLWEIAPRLAGIQDKRQTAYDDAMKELREIRDGKFDTVYPPKDLPDPDVPAFTGRGKSGSKPPFRTR